MLSHRGKVAISGDAHQAKVAQARVVLANLMLFAVGCGWPALPALALANFRLGSVSSRGRLLSAHCRLNLGLRAEAYRLRGQLRAGVGPPHACAFETWSCAAEVRYERSLQIREDIRDVNKCMYPGCQALF